MFASFAEADAHLRLRPSYRRSALDVFAHIPSAEVRAALLAIATANQLTRVHELTRRGDELFGRPGLEPHRAILLDALGRFAARAPSASPLPSGPLLRATLVDLGAEGLLSESVRDLAHVARDERKHALLAHCVGSEELQVSALLSGRLNGVASGELVDLAAHLVRERARAGTPKGPPPEGALGELHRALADRYATLSAERWPLPMPRTLDDLPLEHSRDPIEPVVFLRLPNFCRVEILFAPGALELRCGEHGRPCFHHLHLIARVLDELCAPAPSEDWRRLAAVARIPPWERVLHRLREAAARDRERIALEARPAFLVEELGDGRLRVLAGIRRRHRRTGEWLAPQVRPPIDVLNELDLLLGPAERRALELIHAAPLSISPLVLHALVGLSHVYLRRPDGEATELSVERHESRLALSLEGAGAVEIRAGGIVLTRPTLGYVMTAARDRIVVTDVPRQLIAAAADLHRVLPLVPAAERPGLVEACLSLGPTHPIELPDAAVATVEAASEWIVRLTTAGAVLRVEHLVRPIPGGPLHPAAEGLDRVFAARPDGVLLEARRDLEREQQLLESRWTDWLGEPRATAALVLSDPETILGFLVRLRDEPRGATVEWASRPWTVRRGTGRFDVRVSAIEDRFGLKGALDVGGTRVALAVLLDLVRRQSGYVRLDDETWLELDEGLRQRLRTLAAHVRTRRGELEVSPHSVPAVEAALAEADAERPPRWQAVLARARAAEGLDPRVPRELRAELRPYQVEGYRWLARLAELGAGAVLADDMGLGKTVQALALLARRRRLGPALVVAPTSVTFNWARELARFTPSLEVVRLAGRSRDLEGLGPGTVVVVSYALLVNELPRLAETRFATVVLDEAQAIKNADTRRARAARELQGEFVVALTGTPIENHVGELWSIFAAVLPGLLGSKSDFDERFADGRDLELLAGLVRPFVLRRTKDKVLGELPPKTEMREDVMLSPEERKIYDESKIALAARVRGLAHQLGPTGRIVILAAITELRQLACDVGLVVERAAPSEKLVRMGELAESLVEEGHHVLVFSQFVRLLDRAERVLEGLGVPFHRLDGSTPAERRGAIVDAFQQSRPSVLLVSLKAGGTGLNLTTADHVILLDPWWNPAVEDQAADRAHRIGQSRPVTVIRLVSRGTIEDAVLDMHREKRAVAEALFGGASGVEKLSATELVALVAGETVAELGEPRGDPEREGPTSEAPAAAPSPAPPPPRRARPRRATAPTVALLAEKLDPELDRLSPATARLYRRVLGRVLELVGEEPAGPGLAGLAKAYAQAVSSGRFAKSDLPIVNALTGRLLALAR